MVEDDSTDSTGSTPLEDPKPGNATLEERKQRIRDWQKALEAKRLALRPNDAAQKAAYDRELSDYNEELKKVSAEMLKK